MSLGSGNCRSKPGSCITVANPTGEYMLSAYLYTVSGGSFQAGLELHTESGEMKADGGDVSGKTKTDRWIIQSPLAGLDADNYVISAVRSETTTAKMFDFQYDWAGKCFPDWSDVKELTNPLAQETRTRSRPFTATSGRRLPTPQATTSPGSARPATTDLQCSERLRRSPNPFHSNPLCQCRSCGRAPTGC